MNNVVSQVGVCDESIKDQTNVIQQLFHNRLFTQASLGTRARVWWDGIPIVTR